MRRLKSGDREGGTPRPGQRYLCPKAMAIDIGVLALKCGTSPTMIEKVFDHGEKKARALSALN